MKTAVEWLADELCYVTNDGRYIVDNTDDVTDVVNQAKEMEKHQRQEDTNYGYSQGWDDGNQNKEPMRPELKQQEQ
jgi:hypothetical protein